MPRVLNDYLVRKAIRANATYSTGGMFQRGDADVHNIDDDITKKMKSCIEDAHHRIFNVQMEIDDTQRISGRLAGCLERDVEAYYLLFEPKGSQSFHVRYDNPSCTLKTNKVATLNYEQYKKYYDTKIENGMFTIFGIGLLASTAWYMHDYWKNGFDWKKGLLYYTSFAVPAFFVPMPGVIQPLMILGVLSIPQLCVEAARASNAVKSFDLYFTPWWDAVALPITYFLFRSTFKSAFARGLFAATLVFSSDFLISLRENNKSIKV